MLNCDMAYGDAPSVVREINRMLAERAPQPEPQERRAACVPTASEIVDHYDKQIMAPTADERDARLRALIEGIKDWSGETCVSDVFVAIADDLAALRKEGNRDG
jgi:hypothetical protein